MATHDVLAVSGLLGKARKRLPLLEKNLPLNSMLSQPRKSPNYQLVHHTNLSILARPSAIYSIGLWGNQNPLCQSSPYSLSSLVFDSSSPMPCVEYYKKYLVIVGRVELTVFCKLLRGPCEVVELEVICESVLIRFLLPLQNER